MEKITVNVPSGQQSCYEIVIGASIISGELIRRLAGNRHIFIVSDSNVACAGHLSALDGFDAANIYIVSPAGEQSKNINTVTAIIEQMEAASFGRDSVIIGIGGGTVGDMAGFAAAIFKRGIPVIHIPTTTVAQADSSIGGKTGVDSSRSKNAYGCFWQPGGVVIDVSTLKTLDQTQYRSGLVESVKHALIADAGYFDYISQNLDKILAVDEDALCKMAAYNCRIKANVVEQDPTEKNLRRILNYGHTIGHAVETLSNYTLYHGQCVAIGIIGASLIENRLGIGSLARTERIRSLLAAISQPVRIPAGYQIERLIDVISRDKKAVDKWPRFALIEEIGKAYCKDNQWAHPVGIDIVTDVLRELGS